MKMQRIWRTIAAGLFCLSLVGEVQAAEVVLMTHGRSVFQAGMEIELAVAGVPAGEAVELTVAPTEEKVQKKRQDGAADANAAGPASFTLTVEGDGSTKTLTLPGNSLAPATYEVLDGEKRIALFTVVRGVRTSEMLASQTGPGYKNFLVSNAFNFGNTTPDRTGPERNVRSGRSSLSRHNTALKDDIPLLIYMYWTGYVLHKPWGIHKEWAAPDEIENMRLFNYHVAQRMRRFDDSILFIGSLDEPGLPWGKTASGGSASGFAGWNIQDWIEARGGTYTLDPGSLPDEEFRTYMQLRALMLREAFQQANDDIKEVWPTAIYSTDAYAPQAVGDGTDPMNQVANDVPSTHVFADYGVGKLGVLAGMYIEKAHDPLAKVAHAMNGQLFGDRVPHPGSLYAYHLMQNVMLAAGLESNWWLNFSGLSIGEDEEGRKGRDLSHANLEKINEPAVRLGSVFTEMEPRDHDVAVLWSTTEIWMRVKGVMKVEASNADGEQKALMVADLPEDAINEDGKLKYNAYSVGGNYKGEVMSTFMAVNRAGYPAHILHEDLLPAGKLDNYKVLVMVHQTHDLPAEKRAVIEKWVAAGGTLLVDTSSTVTFEGAQRVDAPSVVDQGYAWGEGFSKAVKAHRSKESLQDTKYFTNWFMESFSRDATVPFGKALARTGAGQVLKTETNELACERHLGGEGELLMVINGYEKLPQLDEGKPYTIWNYAPYEATYTLPSLKKTDVVYCIEGLDWKTVGRVEDPTAPQQASFQPGEMKLYLVAPSEPKGITLDATLKAGAITLAAALDGPAMPWPLTLTITGPDGAEVTKAYRTMNAEGRYEETISLGSNAPAGNYTVTLSSPVADLQATATLAHTIAAPTPAVVADTVRVFDADAIRKHLAGKPELVIALANDAHKPVAESLAAALKAAGLTVSVQPEAELWEKALYPRVWDPYAPLFTKTDALKPLPEVQKLDERGRPVRDEEKKVIMIPGTVKQELRIESDYYETPTVTTMDGEAFTGTWQQQGTLLTVGPKGYVQIGGQETFYEPGVKLFCLDQRRLVPLNGERLSAKTDEAFRAKWARPWKRIIGHVGGYNLTPQLPECYRSDHHLILLGDSHDGTLTAALQASDLLLQVADERYPGPGKALVQFAWSPFALEKNVIFIGASDQAGLAAGAAALVEKVLE